MPVRPNIVLIQAESMDGRLLGCLGHPAMAGATPHLDQLAADGVLFEHTYCNFPLCCPSRASVWSGRWPHRIGAWNNAKGLAPDAPTFASRLASAGYDTRILGRTDHLSGHHSLAVRIGSWTRAAAIPRPLHGEGHPPQVIPEPRLRVHERDWQSVDQACAFLHGEVEPAAPFLLYLGFHSVHHPFASSSSYLERIPEDRVNLPPRDRLAHPLLSLQRLQKNWGHALDPDGLRLRRRIYFAMVAEVDAMVGAVLDALDAAGLRERTWVLFTSDHGEMAGEHDQYIKLTHFEASARVPLLMCGPDAQHGVRMGRPASLVDLYPTLLDLAGLEAEEDMDGQSLVPELAGVTSDRSGCVFAEHHSTSCPTGTFMLREGDWKFMAYPGYPSLLFNLRDDPDELEDLTTRSPTRAAAMNAALRAQVDIDAVDARAKEEDRRLFMAWRDAAMREGDYAETMARVYGKGVCPPPWREQDEDRIRHWLAGRPVPLPEIGDG